MEDYLKRIRYRDGRIDGYTSRLHYIAEWVESGVQNGFIKDITAMNSTDTVPLKLSFMSTHPNAYRHLKDSPENVKKIKDVERKLSVGSFHYLPKEKISDEGLPWIKDGDIFCITTNIAGLDVVHLGFACYRDGQLKLLHASSSSKQVVLSRAPLHKCSVKQNWTGRKVLRMIRKIFIAIVHLYQTTPALKIQSLFYKSKTMQTNNPLRTCSVPSPFTGTFTGRKYGDDTERVIAWYVSSGMSSVVRTGRDHPYLPHRKD